MERRDIGLGLVLVALLCVTNAFAQTLAVGERDALSTVEANRPKLIARMVDQYRAPLEAHAITVDAFRAALWDLSPDRLLAASLADSIEEVNAIVAQALSGPSRADDKDGPGTGTNSWIGYTAGSNQASGTGSAVAAGTNNVASGQNAFVGAGTFNAATAQGAFVGGGTSNVAAASCARAGTARGCRLRGPCCVLHAQAGVRSHQERSRIRSGSLTLVHEIRAR
jgi:hypothetical protein